MKRTQLGFMIKSQITKCNGSHIVRNGENFNWLFTSTVCNYIKLSIAPDGFYFSLFSSARAMLHCNLKGQRRCTFIMRCKNHRELWWKPARYVQQANELSPKQKVVSLHPCRTWRSQYKSVSIDNIQNVLNKYSFYVVFSNDLKLLSNNAEYSLEFYYFTCILIEYTDADVKAFRAFLLMNCYDADGCRPSKNRWRIDNLFGHFTSCFPLPVT